LLCEAGLRGKFFAKMRRLGSFVRLRRTQDDNRFAGRRFQQPSDKQSRAEAGTTQEQKQLHRWPLQKLQRPASEGGRYKNKSKSTGLKTGHYKN
jgi:hypothetical protein